MQSAHQVSFAHFRVDLANEQLWRGHQPLPLRRQTFAVLRYLVEHAGQVVSKAVLLDALWPGVYVTDMAPMICIRELRKALGDDARVPQFIETVHRRGYRFLPTITTLPLHSLESRVQRLASKNSSPPLSDVRTLDPRRQTLDVPLVGRETELAQLHCWLEKALNGERQIVFVTGEPGIGKTALVEAFLAGLRQRAIGNGQQKDTDLTQLTPDAQSLLPVPWLGRGQCVEHYGASEPYLPILEALGRLGRTPEGERLIAALRQYAPTWLVHLPALLPPDEREQLQRQVQGTTPQRMLRELAEAVEALTADQGLILTLEDLHWSDVSTLTWLSFLAQRRESARLLVIGSYRPVEVLGNEHPLRVVAQELLTHRQGAELRLGMLSEAAVGEYVTQRLSEKASDRAALSHLARAIHQRTEGNPLFMVNVVDALMAHKGKDENDDDQLSLQPEDVRTVVPVDLKQMIERQIERLSQQEQQILEVASVVGAEFTAAAVAAGGKAEVTEVEDCCERLARREFFVQAQGGSEWPDGTVSAHYRFLHALYQEVLYSRVTPGRRVELHRRIGEREEQAYRQRTHEIAAELAVHFERGRDHRKAVQYLHQAGENANRRSAYQEAVNLLTKGLELLKSLPDTSEHTQQELSLQITLGVSLAATEGWVSPEVERVYTRARELCQRVGESPQLFPILQGLHLFYLVHGKLWMARELGEQLLRLAQNAQDLALRLEAHRALGAALFYLGELVAARAHVEQGIALYDPQQHGSRAFLYGFDPGVLCLSWAAWALWFLGYPDQALKRSQEALTLVRELSHPYTLAVIMSFAAWFHQCRREGRVTQERAEASITLSTAQGFPLPLAFGTISRGWALVEQGQGEEGIAQIRQGLAASRDMGIETPRAMLLALLAEAYERVGQVEEGLTVLAEALATVDKTGECFWEAELYRLKGELLLNAERGMQNDERKIKTTRRASSPIHRSAFIGHRSVEAEACFLKAIDIARRQQAKSLELRATMSLAQLWQQQGKREEARQMLAETYAWFTEGFDTKDLQEAKALLEALA
jgi:DNA-binding winged helix-turn-helix (wHTH) protein/predicted ATPase